MVLIVDRLPAQGDPTYSTTGGFSVRPAERLKIKTILKEKIPKGNNNA